jgi:hypothetical protein
MKPAVVGLALCVFASPALAYTTKKDDGSACTKDGTSCNVYCDNGDLAGWIFWSGEVWTDGVRSSADFDIAAQQVCAAHSVSCT